MTTERLVPAAPAPLPEGFLPGAVRDGQSISPTWEATTQRPLHGVTYKEVRHVPKENGHLTEVLRSEWLDGASTIDQIFTVTLNPGGLSAWHMHGFTVDRLFCLAGLVKIVLFDARPSSPTFGELNVYRLGTARPALLVVPPGVWHGVQNIHAAPSILLNAVDQAYIYEGPDHWRLPVDTDQIPYRFTP